MLISGFFIVVIFLAIMGIVLFIGGFIILRKKRLIENIPTSKIRSLAMGLVEIVGQVVPVKNKILKSPFSERDCVYYRYTIQEYRRSGKNSHWVTIKKGERKELFYLKDDTGMVLVDPAGASIEVARDNELHSGMGEDPPESVVRFLAANNIAFEGLLGLNKTMRYSESYIAPDDNLYIMGTADENPYADDPMAVQGAEDAMIRKGTQEKMYYISDKQERDILRGLSLKISVCIGIGSLCLIIGILGVIEMLI